ncbi:MAG TPA: alpha-1,4-glucan--maltose-1-phosphate maltosyltransferase [Polyangiaceae bacterium]|nr:alpha-1,4-glucan--maltose-1-phosphate maltosyltransferase [Polyangiaceae bacterium]
MPELTPGFELPRVVIEQVTPTLDGGRHPIKRTIGSTVEVSAAVFKDGHDLVGARVAYRGPRETTFQTSPLVYRFDPDRWFGSFRADRLGRFTYAIEAWPDHFGTFRSDLEKRLNAGQDVRPELVEGAVLIERYAAELPPEISSRVLPAAQKLRDYRASLDERLAAVLSDELRALLAGPLTQNELTRSPLYELIVDRPEATFSAWYELFPRSESPIPGKHGTFRDTIQRLPEIAALGFDVIYLPPIHPIGEHKRKGRNNSRTAERGDVGSPWAIGSKYGGHTAVHPELGTIEDFELLVRSAREFGMEIALDYALQCAPDHPWVREHPDWFDVRTDGSIRYAENPPKKYEDIYPLNFWCDDRKALWEACRDVLLFWIARGVRVFRVDNPHTKPFAFWEWVLREINERHPEVFFLSESFTRPNRMKGLAKLGFNQSYTYFTWKNSAWELKDYLTELTQPEMLSYFRPNFFANTPDILHEYLQTGGRPAFRIRLVLAGTLSPSYGIYSGFELCENVPVRHGSEEYLDSEKYQIRQRDYNAPHNIKQDIGKLNRIRRENPALQELGNLEFLHSEYEGILAYRKHAPGNEIVVVVNLDPFHMHETMIHMPVNRMGIGEGEPYEVADLLSGARYTWRGTRNYVRLDPSDRVAHVFRVSRRSD